MLKIIYELGMNVQLWYMFMGVQKVLLVLKVHCLLNWFLFKTQGNYCYSLVTTTVLC